MIAENRTVVMNNRVCTVSAAQNTVVRQAGEGLPAPVLLAPPSTFYVERQVGNQCRRHATNAFCGGAVLDQPTFIEWLTDFEQFYMLGANGPHRTHYDYMTIDGASPVSYCMQRASRDENNLLMVFYPTTEFVKLRDASSLAEALGSKATRYATFNPDHVWAHRKDTQGCWYKLDSLSPTASVSTPHMDSRHGIVVEYTSSGEAETDAERYRAMALEQFGSLGVNTKGDMFKWLSQLDGLVADNSHGLEIESLLLRAARLLGWSRDGHMELPLVNDYVRVMATSPREGRRILYNIVEFVFDILPKK